MRALWPFNSREPLGGGAAAIKDAGKSREVADADRAMAAELRRRAEEAARLVHEHNTANRYDDWLRKVMHGND